MLIQRFLISQLIDSLSPGRVLVLYGPRQVGKTTLIKMLLEKVTAKSIFINADELVYREALSSQNKQVLGDLVAGTELLVIDEAQRVPNIGINLKIMVDNFPKVAVIATGSASFELASKISEPLTGRSLTFHLFPLSYGELCQALGAFEARHRLEQWMVWGGYPVPVTTDSSTLRERLLGELVGAYLYRDILELEGVRRSEKIVDLLRRLAFQIGQEVSLNELASSLSLSRGTVERYLDLLEKVFVIFRLRGFSRNLRKEIAKNQRYYFVDNGVRNSLIQNFNPLSLRNDVGQLWENYLMIERRKVNQALQRSVNAYFWRTYDQKEIDYIEEWGGRLHAFEFKWQGEMRRAVLRDFLKTYPDAELQTITEENFEPFVL